MDKSDPRRLVISTRNGNSYHKPVDVDADEPEPDCQLAQSVDGDHWAWRDKETAYAWKEPCSYCYDNYNASTTEGDSWPV